MGSDSVFIVLYLCRMCTSLDNSGDGGVRVYVAERDLARCCPESCDVGRSRSSTRTRRTYESTERITTEQGSYKTIYSLSEIGDSSNIFPY